MYRNHPKLSLIQQSAEYHRLLTGVSSLAQVCIIAVSGVSGKINAILDDFKSGVGNEGLLLAGTTFWLAPEPGSMKKKSGV